MALKLPPLAIIPEWSKHVDDEGTLEECVTWSVAIGDLTLSINRPKYTVLGSPKLNPPGVKSWSWGLISENEDVKFEGECSGYLGLIDDSLNTEVLVAQRLAANYAGLALKAWSLGLQRRLRAYADGATQVTARQLSNFKVHVTLTGRVSSNKENLSNFPKSEGT